jgi:hypothetical protein
VSLGSGRFTWIARSESGRRYWVMRTDRGNRSASSRPRPGVEGYGPKANGREGTVEPSAASDFDSVRGPQTIEGSWGVWPAAGASQPRATASDLNVGSARQGRLPCGASWKWLRDQIGVTALTVAASVMSRSSQRNGADRLGCIDRLGPAP